MKKLLFIAAALLVGLSTFAQDPGPYQAQRCTLFDLIPVTSKDIVFMGNSITNGCEWSELFNNRHVKNRGINGDRARWLVNRIDSIIVGRPKKLFLMIGTNDLSDGRSPREVVGHIRKVIDRFQKESPWTKLYIQSLLPVNSRSFTGFENHYSRGPQIVETNKLLRALCEEKGVTYVDVFAALVDQNGDLNAAYTNDGLHLMGPAYMVWKEVLKPYMK